MKYKCLVLDHDDTTVNSTATVHYPSFLNTLKERNMLHLNVTLDDYFALNCDPGLHAYYRDVVGLNEDEIAQETRDWLVWVSTHIPDFYEGMDDIIRKQKEEGGMIAVVSHSRKENIIRDYKASNLPVPDFIYGSELPKEKVKPGIFPIMDILEKTGLNKSDLLMVDDLIMGHQMAEKAGIDFVCAAWAHSVPMIEEYFNSHNVNIFKSPKDLYDYLFAE